MATLIQMICNDCNYSSAEIRFGQTWIDQRNLGPAFDTDSNTIVEIDLDAAPATTTIPYTNSKLFDKTKSRPNWQINAGDHTMQTNACFCPSCNGFTLGVVALSMID